MNKYFETLKLLFNQESPLHFQGACYFIRFSISEYQIFLFIWLKYTSAPIYSTPDFLGKRGYIKLTWLSAVEGI